MGSFDLRVKLPPSHLSTTYSGGFTLFLFIAERQGRKAVNANFYSLWFDLTGNRIRVYCFSSTRPLIG